MTYLFKNKKKLLILIIILSLILLLIVYVGYIFFKRESTQNNLVKEEYKKFVLSNFNTYFYPKHFSLSNSVDLNNIVFEDNYIYEISDFREFEVNMSNLANKLGLNKMLTNQNNRTYRWVKNNLNDVDNIYLDLKDGFCFINYSSGINNNVLNNTEEYKSFIQDTLGIKNIEIEIDSKDILQLEDYKFVSIKAKFNSKTIYFNEGSDVFMDITVYKGKVISVNFSLFSAVELKKVYQLKPLSKVERNIIRSLNYKINIKPDDYYSSKSLYGNVLAPDFPIEIGFRQFKETGYIVFNNDNKWLLVPVIVISGLYKSLSSDQRGSLDFVVVNQTF